MRKLDFFWRSRREWYHYDEDHIQVINDDAPEEAKASYAHYLQQIENEEKTGLIY